MADSAQIRYKRLPGTGYKQVVSWWIIITLFFFIGIFALLFRGRKIKLWLGDDHLLQVELTEKYTEEYKRFYFKDIQAFCIQRTNAWYVTNMVFGFLAAILFGWLLTVQDSAGKIALGIFAGLFTLFLVINLLTGPTCICYLRTAVQEVELLSLRRRRNAEKVLARLKPLIEAAQGGLPPDALAPQYDGLLASAHATPGTPDTSGQIGFAPASVLQPYRSRIHQILFLILLAEAATDTLSIFMPVLPLVVLNTLIGLLLAGVMIVALVKQYQTDLQPSVRMLTWLAAAYLTIGFVSSYFITLGATPPNHTDGTQWGYLKALAEIKPFETTWRLGVLGVSAVLSAAFGAAGLLLLRGQRREIQTGA